MTILSLGWSVSRLTCLRVSQLLGGVCPGSRVTGITELSSRPKWRDLLCLFPEHGLSRKESVSSQRAACSSSAPGSAAQETCGLSFPLSAPETAVEGAVLNGFRYMTYSDVELGVEVRDGASNFEYPVVRPGAQALLLHRPFKQPFRFR